MGINNIQLGQLKGNIDLTRVVRTRVLKLLPDASEEQAVSFEKAAELLQEAGDIMQSEVTAQHLQNDIDDLRDSGQQTA